MDTIDVIVTAISNVAANGGQLTMNQQQAKILQSALSGLGTLALSNEQQAALIQSFSDDSAEINEITREAMLTITDNLGLPESGYDPVEAQTARDELAEKIRAAKRPTELLDAAIRIGMHLAAL